MSVIVAFAEGSQNVTLVLGLRNRSEGGGIEPPTRGFSVLASCTQEHPPSPKNNYLEGDPPLDRGRWMLLGDAQPRQPGLSVQTWEGRRRACRAGILISDIALLFI